MQAIKHYGLMYTYSTAQEQIFYQSAGSPKIHDRVDSPIPVKILRVRWSNQHTFNFMHNVLMSKMVSLSQGKQDFMVWKTLSGFGTQPHYYATVGQLIKMQF